MMLCTGSDKMIHPEQWCDSEPQCPGGEDENYCEGQSGQLFSNQIKGNPQVIEMLAPKNFITCLLNNVSIRSPQRLLDCTTKV